MICAYCGNGDGTDLGHAWRCKACGKFSENPSVPPPQPQAPPVQVQQQVPPAPKRRSGCGTALLALIVVPIAIVVIVMAVTGDSLDDLDDGAGGDERTAETDARPPLTEKQTRQARREFADEFDRWLLENRIDADRVRVRGKRADVLWIKYALCSRVFVMDLEKASRDMLTALGFRRLKCYDGFRDSAWVDL